MIIGPETSQKPVMSAGEPSLLCACDMEREITQVCMLVGVRLGALEWLRGIDDAYAKLENEVAVTNRAMTIPELDYFIEPFLCHTTYRTGFTIMNKNDILSCLVSIKFKKLSG